MMQGGYAYADRFQNTAYAGMATASNTEARLQTRGRRSGVCTRDKQRPAARVRPVPAYNRSRFKGAHAPTVDRRRSAGCCPAPCGAYDRPTGSGTGTYQRIH